MKKRMFLYLLPFYLLYACNGGGEKPASSEKKSNTRAEAIKEIRKAEEDFAALCLKEGMQTAFSTFCADSAHLRSADSLVSGKTAIIKYYGQPFFKKVTLQWTPDFVDASESGDLGYTFGHYTFTIQDNGRKTVNKGVFHTVWKKQNGVWRFVWDS